MTLHRDDVNPEMTLMTKWPKIHDAAEMTLMVEMTQLQYVAEITLMAEMTQLSWRYRNDLNSRNDPTNSHDAI